MCPACIASGALLIAGAVSGGGLAALASKLLPSQGGAKTISSEKPKREEK
jgi:hypothetical protein